MTWLATPPAWTRDALCAQIDPDLWFPETGGNTTPARRICAKCPVASECLDAAIRRGEMFGIWGGTSEKDRRGKA